MDIDKITKRIINIIKNDYLIDLDEDEEMGLTSDIKDVTELILTAADVRGADKQYQHLMQERPRPGKGGLLPGEKEEDLYEKL